MITMELGRTNPANNSAPYYFLDNDIYVESFRAHLGSRENWRVYLPVPYAKNSKTDYEDITMTVDQWYSYLKEKNNEAECAERRVFERIVVQPSTLSAYKQHEEQEEALNTENLDKTEIITSEMRLFATYWCNKTIRESDTNERFNLNEFISGLIDASPFVLFSGWMECAEDIVTTDRKENYHENNLMTFSFEAEPQTNSY